MTLEMVGITLEMAGIGAVNLFHVLRDHVVQYEIVEFRSIARFVWCDRSNETTASPHSLVHLARS